MSESRSEVVFSEQQEKPEITYVSTLLYHGAKRPFTYKNDYRFDENDLDGSFTLGEGIYLTDKLDSAVEYSKVRQHSETANPIIFSISAQECKFLDFRGEDGNLPVEQEMVVRWRDYFRTYLDKQIDERPDVGPEKVIVDVADSPIRRRMINQDWLDRKELQDYLAYLNEIIDEEKSVDLRFLLGVDRVEETNTDFDGDITRPQWSGLFRQFMLDEDYDGVIYLEGSEIHRAGQHPSFVVYNLDSIKISDKPIDLSE